MNLNVNDHAEYGNDSEKDHENNRDVENQTLYATACFKHGASAAATESAAQSRPAYL
jgi:hypothetical protein